MFFFRVRLLVRIFRVLYVPAVNFVSKILIFGLECLVVYATEIPKNSSKQNDFNIKQVLVKGV